MVTVDNGLEDQWQNEDRREAMSLGWAVASPAAEEERLPASANDMLSPMTDFAHGERLPTAGHDMFSPVTEYSGVPLESPPPYRSVMRNSSVRSDGLLFTEPEHRVFRA
jgi:hypothetical protein